VATTIPAWIVGWSAGTWIVAPKALQGERRRKETRIVDSRVFMMRVSSGAVDPRNEDYSKTIV